MPSITENRRELKFRLRAGEATSVLGAVAEHVPQHRFDGTGGNPLPRARSYVTTVYFDTKSRDLYRAVRENEDNLKVRAREYYDLHPELLEVATRPSDLVRYSPVLWVELKAKTQGRTWKRRIGIPKADVHAFFARREVSAAMQAIQDQKANEGDVIGELSAIRDRYAEPLEPSCLVNYRRTSYQSTDGSLRITVDQRLACFAPPEGLFTEAQPMVRERLGRPSFEEAGYILEVKATGALPAWLEQALEQAGIEPLSFSKFRTASEAVHGRDLHAVALENRVR
jgi:hypothetical protein